MAATKDKGTASRAQKRSPTAAEAELQGREAQQNPDKQLQEDAKEQRKTQREELAAGKSGPKGARFKTVAESRSKRPGEKPLNATVDNMTARDGSDPLEGHFVTIDYSDKKTRDMVKAQLGDHVEPGTHSADYGVYLEAGEVGEDGYPVTGRVFLRDEHAAIINVPFDALRRSQAGGRR